MKKSIFYFLNATLVMTVISVNSSCNKTAGAKDSAEKTETAMTAPYTPAEGWNNYWYQGKAELTSYTLNQARYTETHSGTVVNIFVTEDFSKSKHVKLDNPDAAGADKLPILKLNQSYKFNTGIYPYSSMQSVFMPVDMYNYPHAVKISSSVQEWCGVAFMQLNNYGERMSLQQFSYFESEGDKEFTFDPVYSEDELWTLIRLAPEKLPQGTFPILPGMIYLRYSHKPVKPYSATFTLKENNNLHVYTIAVPELQKTLTITFEKLFPYTITGWEESYPVFSGEILTTTATLNKTMLIDYWNKHTNADRSLRKELGLPE
ncbi:MAG: hypothetical protein ACK4IY_07450, partial [Chitinophagales bacterium]